MTQEYFVKMIAVLALAGTICYCADSATRVAAIYYKSKCQCSQNEHTTAKAD